MSLSSGPYQDYALYGTVTSLVLANVLFFDKFKDFVSPFQKPNAIHFQVPTIQCILRFSQRAIASAFSHAQASHLAFNMATLTFLSAGLKKNDSGSVHLLALYGSGAIGGALGHTLMSSASRVQGASGAVCAVAAALPLLEDKSTPSTLFLVPPVEIPVSWGSALVLLALLNPRDIVARGARLSLGAHVGGAAVGGIYGATHVCSTYLWAMAQNY